MKNSIFTEIPGLPARTLLHIMATAREGDRRESILAGQGKGWFQVSGTGHESIAALAYTLRPEDYIFSYYRDRALVQARGITTYEIALSYFAKRYSSSGGRQMPAHFSDKRLNIFSACPTTASQCLPATGVGWACKMAGNEQVVLVTVGDASTRQGEFYEALAFALQENLPVLFVVEDNRYGISTSTDKMFPYRLGVLGEKCLRRVDAREPRLLFEVGAECVARARHQEGPSVLWCEIDRLCPHTGSDDHRLYRSIEELSRDTSRDPLQQFACRLIEEGLLSGEEWEEELAEIAAAVERDYCLAEEASEPSRDSITAHLFGLPAELPKTPLQEIEEPTILGAVNQTLRQALKENTRTLLFGEDIEDPKGGVFGITKGLSTLFPAQVINAPLAEATIFGTAVGLASVGWRPIVELQFIDYIWPGINQLISQMTTLRWRSCGAWSCPVVIIAPYGAYLPIGGPWHSESNEGIWAHIHGLNVVIPSTSEDAAGLLWTAIHGNDPTLFLLPKHIFRKQQIHASEAGAIPLGKAMIRKPGCDVTLVAWGNCVEMAIEAAEMMEKEEISVEVIDLRCITPCDYDAITESLQRTGRLVIVHEDARTTGFGQCIVAEMTLHRDRFNTLLAPPQLVARKDVFVPYNPTLEYATLPDQEQILEAIRATLM